MNFEELSRIWNSQDMELEKSLQINRELVIKVGLAKVKSRLHEIKWEAIVGIPIGVGWLLFLGGFIGQHLAEWKFSIPALLLLALSVYGLISEIYRLVLFYTIDSRSSVIQAQGNLVRLKKLEAMEVQSLLVVIPLFSGPFLVVLSKAIIGLSLYDFDLSWLISYMAGSIVIAALIVFILKKFPNKNLMESISFLEELKEEA